MRLNYFTEDTHGRYRSLVICLLLMLVTFAVYWQVTGHGFISYDDNVYVYENGNVKDGLSRTSMLWAFSFHHETGATYWHPLTWLSHMFDYQLFGLDAGRHHLINLIFHAINTLLLFLLLKRVTGAVWRSAMVAALFAVNPVNVDSVAWIAERKNLLSTMFWLLTMTCYSFYAERPSIFRYIMTSALFIMGLLAKPMLATLPFVLLLFDYWPLHRMQIYFNDTGVNRGVTCRRSPFPRLIIEKVPLMVLSFVAIYISTLELKTGGNLISYSIRPLGLRIANFIVSYASYVKKLFWPTDLTILYPYPKVMLPTASIVFAVIVLLIISVIAVTQIKKRPFLIVGWLWFLGTLVPVSGILQGGVWPAMADRWAYIPFIGLYIMFVWGVSSIFPETHFFNMLKSGSAITIVLILAIMAWIQTGYWKNDITLFSHAVEITDNNYIAHNNLGLALESEHDYQGAVYHYRIAQIIKPNSLKIELNIGVALAKSGRLEDAITQFESILEKDPKNERAIISLGTAYSELNDFKKAEKYFQKALKLHSESAEICFGWAVVLSHQGRTREAVKQYLRALEINPHHIKARVNLANALVRMSSIDDALRHYGEILKIEPNHATAKRNLQVLVSQRQVLDEKIKTLQSAVDQNPEDSILLYHLGLAYQKSGHSEKALTYYELALRYNNELIDAYQNMFLIYSEREDYKEAAETLRKMIQLQPQDPNVHYNFACIYAKINKLDESLQCLMRAVDMGFKDWDLLKKDSDLEALRDTEYFKSIINKANGNELTEEPYLGT